jgi:RNA polymerase sigma factor (TIGR02999 family)
MGSMQANDDLTAMLRQLESGGRAAVDALLPQVYEQLRELAHRQLRGERPDHTLNTTALVHEAYLKLIGQTRVSWQNRAHFLGVAAVAMRRLLIDHAHRSRAAKRGGGVALLTWTEGMATHESGADDLLALDQALSRLTELNARQGRIAESRLFGGLNDDEIAEVVGVSVPTVRRDWRVARAWLADALS